MSQPVLICLSCSAAQTNYVWHSHRLHLVTALGTTQLDVGKLTSNAVYKPSRGSKKTSMNSPSCKQPNRCCSHAQNQGVNPGANRNVSRL